MNFANVFSALANRFRILPAVLVVGTGLLVLKGNDVVLAAVDGISHASEASHPDFAVDDNEQSSAAEVDVLTSLSKRRQELDNRGADMTTRENVLSAIEKRVDEKIANLKELQGQIDALLAKRDAEQQKQVDALVKIYAAMKPANAARIFNNLSDDVLIPVAQQMKSDALAAIMSAMNPDVAQKLTQKLANKLQLPEKAAPDAAPQSSLPSPDGLLPPGMPQPQQTSEAQGPQQQQAALAPPPAAQQPALPTPPAPVAPAPAKPAPVAAAPAPAKPAAPAHKAAAPAKVAATPSKPSATPAAAAATATKPATATDTKPAATTAPPKAAATPATPAASATPATAAPTPITPAAPAQKAASNTH